MGYILLNKRIIQLIKQKNTRKSNTLERDIQIILLYFGLGSQGFPTLKSVGDKFELSKQRVLQIIEDRFTKKVSSDEFNVVYEIEKTIEKKPVHFVDNLLEELIDGGLIEGEVSIVGVLNLLKSFDLCNEYDIYNSSIKKASRFETENEEYILLVNSKIVSELNSEYKAIRTVPGMHGIVNLYEIKTKNDISINYEFYKKIIINTQRAWTLLDTNGQLWYMFEDRDNCIINNLEKLSNITNYIDRKILSEIMENSLHRRTLEYSTPNAKIIDEYFCNSKYTNVIGNYVKLKVEKSELLDIEKDILSMYHLSKKNSLIYPEIRKYLSQKGYSDIEINKAVYYSPLLFKDKTQGERNYRFILAKFFSPAENDIQSFSISDYETFKEKLKNLYGQTDLNAYVKIRREQHVLREWLFEGKNSENCAICGREFSISTLVAAHKKKRSNCSENERTDPHIVMPLCLFGCDYIYESGLIRIIDGFVKTTNMRALTETERKYVQMVNTKKIDERWLEGSEQYFR